MPKKLQKSLIFTVNTIQEFQQAAINRKTSFKSQYEQASEHPLGLDPILVIGCSISLNEKNKLIGLQFRLSSKQRISMKLTVPMIQRIVSLIEKLQLRAGWGLVDSPQDSLVNSGVSGDLKNILH
jgi:sensor domain CHASE-containing protein